MKCTRSLWYLDSGLFKMIHHSKISIPNLNNFQNHFFLFRFCSADVKIVDEIIVFTKQGFFLDLLHFNSI